MSWKIKNKKTKLFNNLTNKLKVCIKCERRFLKTNEIP